MFIQLIVNSIGAVAGSKGIDKVNKKIETLAMNIELKSKERSQQTWGDLNEKLREKN